MPNPIYSNPVAAGGGSKLNVFISETQPTAQNGLWVKKAKSAVTGVEIDNAIRGINFSDVVLPGSYAGLDNNFSYAATFPIVLKIGNVIYASPSTWGSSTPYGYRYIKYDIETSIFSIETITASTSVSVDGILSQNVVVIGSIVYAVNQTNRVLKIDYETNTYTYTYSTALFSTNYRSAGIGEKDGVIYILCGVRRGYYTSIYAFDTETNVATQFVSDLSTNFSNIYGKFFFYDGKLFFFSGSASLQFTCDINTREVTSVREFVTEAGAADTALFPAYGMVQIGETIYFIGLAGSSSASATANSAYSYNLLTGASAKISDELGSTQALVMSGSINYLPGYYFDGSSLFVFGGLYYQSDSYRHYQNIVKVIFTSNDLPTGTVWAHESTSENVTEMYKDKTMTLNLGIDKVLIQEEDGLKVQPAAIIKNGVVTDIGGGITPEPTTPTLEGTWVLNETLVAPESDFNVYTSFTVGSSVSTQYAASLIRTYTTSGLHRLSVQLTTGIENVLYNFGTNAWEYKYKYLIFPSGATASDNFITWLAANATKQ